MRRKSFGSFGSFFLLLFAVLFTACSGTGRSAVGVEDFPGPLMELSIRFPPQKTVYIVGDSFDPQGLVVDGRFANSGLRQIPVDVLGFDGFDSTAPVEQQVITVSYHGLQTQFTIRVNPPDDLEAEI